MNSQGPADRQDAFLHRLVGATNSHNIAAVIDCFAVEYLNETPAHPARGFTGRDQVKRNWEQIFALVPNITATIIRQVVDGDVVWSEWEMRGTRRDGSEHLMRGVIIFGIRDGRATWARFYLEPVQEGGGDVNEAVGRAVAPRSGA
jgi:ketosteroid isomerase-like protein